MLQVKLFFCYTFIFCASIFAQKTNQPIWYNSYESVIESSDSLTKKGKELGVSMQDLGMKLPSNWDIFTTPLLDSISFPCLLHTFSDKNTFLVANRLSSFCSEDIVFKTKKEKEDAPRTFQIYEFNLYYLGVFEKNAQTNKPTRVKNMYTNFFNMCLYKGEAILLTHQKIDTNFSVFRRDCSDKLIDYWSDYQVNSDIYLSKINTEGVAWQIFLAKNRPSHSIVSDYDIYFQDSILWVSILECQYLKPKYKYKINLHAYNLKNGVLLKKNSLDSFAEDKSVDIYVKIIGIADSLFLPFLHQSPNKKIYQIVQKNFNDTSRRSKKELIELSPDNKIQKYSEPKLPVGYAILLKKFPKNAPLPANFEPQFWRGQAERAGGSLQMVEVAGQICYFAGTWALEKDRDKAFETLKIEFPKAEKIRVEDWKPISEK